MYRTRIMEDPDRRWRRFGRTGRRLATSVAAIWFILLWLMLGTTPIPNPLPRETPPQVAWWPGSGAAGMEGGHSMVNDIRVTWSPSIFALPSPAGFSHSLRQDRARLTPPDQAVGPEAAFLETAPAAVLTSPTVAMLPGLLTVPQTVSAWPAPSVFPPRATGADGPRMIFPEGWESRLFSGMDPGYGSWSPQAWSARIEMRFDADGVPDSVLLVQSSGLADVDRRLVRSVRGWRLLDVTVPRQGVVAWMSSAIPPASATERTVP